MASMHGLDLSFLKTAESRRALDVLREEAESKRSEPRPEPKRSDLYAGSGAFVLPDLNAAYKDGGFRSPIDDTWISSRSQLRAHNARHGVIQTGDIRGEAAKEKMHKHMKYDPSLIGSPDFSWGKPD